MITAPHWSVHLPAGMPADQVDLAEGGSLVGAFLARWREDPAAIVVTTPDGVQVCAEELEHRTRTAALRFVRAGLVWGDRILLSAGTSVELVVAYVGALRAGLAVVPANTAYTGPELSTLLAAARPALAVLDDPSRLSGVDVACPVTTVDLTGLPAPHPDPQQSMVDVVGPNDTALIIYTSGTTGHPKGVPLSHANLLASAHAVRLAWRWNREDRLILCLPLFHVHGLGVGLHGTLVAGASAVLLPAFEPGAVGEAVDAGASLLFGVPTMYHRLAQSPWLAQLAKLRLVVSGSAPLPADLHQEIFAATGQAVLERYGMTETIMLVSNPYDGHRRPGTVGFALPGVDVRLAPVEGGDAEIQVRGPNVVRGYLRNPEATAAAYTSDGWFRTGDLGRLDSDGYLIISGRAKELIITGGYNVYPREVEEVIRSCPGVADAAVAGVTSAQWGEEVVAFVVGDVVDESAFIARLTDWCGQRLAGYKRPKQWRLVEAIPRNAMGKIVRHELRG